MKGVINGLLVYAYVAALVIVVARAAWFFAGMPESLAPVSSQAPAEQSKEQ